MEHISQATKNAVTTWSNKSTPSDRATKNAYSVRHIVDLYESDRIVIDKSYHCEPYKKDVIKHVSTTGKLPSVGTFGNRILSYFQEIGADKQLPSDEHQRKGYVMRFHHHLCLLNELFPADLPYPFVYNCFFHAVIHNRVELKGFNIREHIRVFHLWWNESKNSVYELYYRKHPEKQPKLLKQENVRSLQDQIEGLKKTIATMERLGMDERAIQGQKEMLNQLQAKDE